MRLRVFTFLTLLSLLATTSVDSYAFRYQEEKAEQKNDGAKEATDKTAQSENTADMQRPEILAPTDSLWQNEQDISHYLSANKVTAMLAGSEDFITIINENTASNQKGVMILLPDWNMGATSSNALNYLHDKLPQQGWTTIAIQPSPMPEGYPSSALTTKIQAEENSKVLAQYQEHLTKMITAVMEKAKDYPGIFVTVAQGSNATLLANLYSTGKLESPSAMVMLSGYLHSQSHSLSFAKTLASSEFPLLDIYLAREHQLAKTNAMARKAQAKKEMKVYYRQTQLHNNQISFYPEQSLLRAINGWLKSIGW